MRPYGSAVSSVAVAMVMCAIIVALVAKDAAYAARRTHRDASLRGVWHPEWGWRRDHWRAMLAYADVV